MTDGFRRLEQWACHFEDRAFVRQLGVDTLQMWATPEGMEVQVTRGDGFERFVAAWSGIDDDDGHDVFLEPLTEAVAAISAYPRGVRLRLQRASQLPERVPVWP